ncbi:MAG: MBL fold metallo-hydrolase [Desulfosalsimonas sp.]
MLIKITFLYDNDAWDKRLRADWGFAALVEAFGRTILFDTGAGPKILLHNMKLLGISPGCIDEIFISHDHWDHTGGLREILGYKAVPVYVPDTMQHAGRIPGAVAVQSGREIAENIHSTGTLKNIEQSLCIVRDGNVTVIAGCSHPGVGTILSAASQLGRPRALVGGLHGFSDFQVLSGLDLVCATHCTRHKEKIRSQFPQTAVAGGAGRVLQI